MALKRRISRCDPGALSVSIVSWLTGPSAQATSIDVPGTSRPLRPLSLRAETARPAHSPYSAPATRPNTAQPIPVTTASSTKLCTPPPPKAPAKAPTTTPNSPQLIRSLLAQAFTPWLGSATCRRPPESAQITSSTWTELGAFLDFGVTLDATCLAASGLG